jgi:hypothetical protein
VILVTSDHAGETLCEAAKLKKIDVLVMGRRGLSSVKRVFLGSTSQFCMEHAHCQVMVVKKEVTDFVGTLCCVLGIISRCRRRIIITCRQIGRTESYYRRTERSQEQTGRDQCGVLQRS